MKTKLTRLLPLTAGLLLSVGGIAQASSDYAPAIWRPAYSGHWYTTGNGHKFTVCHDMEGYYLSSISYMQRSTTSASCHYCVNGLTDSSDGGAAPGEISQMVLEANYAWHAVCWNRYSFGTEHEGFVSNPAWFTDAMYNATGLLQRHLCDVWSIAKDRNHVVGHDEKKNAAWCTYAEATFGIDAHCNSHTDPGQYWDWAKLMGIINPPANDVIVDNSNAGFSCSATWTTGTSATDKYGSNYRWRSAQPISDQATFTASLAGGSYTVSAWYPAGSNRNSATPFICSTSGGNQTVNVNQQANGGQWVTLGTWNMNAGNNTAKVSCWVATNTIVVADAVKWHKN